MMEKSEGVQTKIVGGPSMSKGRGKQTLKLRVKKKMVGLRRNRKIRQKSRGDDKDWTMRKSRV